MKKRGLVENTDEEDKRICRLLNPFILFIRVLHSQEFSALGVGAVREPPLRDSGCFLQGAGSLCTL